jgi:hypothetical protein
VSLQIVCKKLVWSDVGVDLWRAGLRRASPEQLPDPQPAGPVRLNAQCRPRFLADDPIDYQAIGSLEGHHGGMCAATENAIDD